jgi:hypothetical protein
MSFKSALEFHNRTLDKLVTKVDSQKDLLLIVQSVLPENLAAHTLHCVIHDTTLLIYTDAAVWSSQLRFYQTTILEIVARQFQQSVQRVQIRLFRQS